MIRVGLSVVITVMCCGVLICPVAAAPVWMESSDPDMILRDARRSADAALDPRLPDTSLPPIADIVGMFVKAETLDAKRLTAEDAGRLGRLYLQMSPAYADRALAYLELAADNPANRTALGNAWLYMNDPERAKAIYLSLPKDRIDDPVVQMNLAQAEWRMGDKITPRRRLGAARDRADPRTRGWMDLLTFQILSESGDTAAALSAGRSLWAATRAREIDIELQTLFLLQRLCKQARALDALPAIDRRLIELGHGEPASREARREEKK